MSDAGNSISQSSSSEIDLEKVVRNIFETCDEMGTGRVLVSKLIDYITPFMSENVSNAMMLKELLDPGDVNPEVTSVTFFAAMSDWAKKFNQEDTFHNISPREFDNPPPLVVSTPRASFGNRQLRVYAEAAALNVSIVEGSSSGDGNESRLEKSILEDHIKELMYQNRKYNDELTLARSQLLSQEEHTEMLQNEIEKLTKQLTHERDANESLVKESKILDDLRDTSINMQKYIDKLQQQLLHFEKENQLFKSKSENLEHEKQKTEEKMMRLHEKLSKSRHHLIELQAEMHMKDEQITYMEDSKNKLLSKICDLTHSIDNYKESNHCLKIEKDKVTKMLQENIKKYSKVELNYSPSSNNSKYQKTIPTTQNEPHATSTTIGNKSPIPFSSPIKTTIFTFYNKDSPYAKRCSPSSTLQVDDNNAKHIMTPDIQNKQFTFDSLDSKATAFCKSLVTPVDFTNSPPNMYIIERSCGDNNKDNHISTQEIQTEQFTLDNLDLHSKGTTVDTIKAFCKSPVTPTDLKNSPPNMYIIERSGDTRPATGNISFDESSTEKEMLDFCSLAGATQTSLMDELAAVSSQIVKKSFCETCKDRQEIEHRLDDLNSQIEWLKTENENLRKSEEEYYKLVQFQKSLEEKSKKQNVTIEDLTNELENAKRKVIELTSISSTCAETTMKLTIVENELSTRNAKVAELEQNILEQKTAADDAIKVSNTVRATVLELRDEIQKLENANKSVQLIVKSLEAERENLRKVHASDIEDYTKQFQQSKEDIEELEKKYCESYDAALNCQKKNEELITNNATLYLQNERLVDQVEEIREELNFFTNIINDSFKKGTNTRQKLQMLLRCKDNYEKLKKKHDDAVEEKRAQAEDFNAIIKDLENRCILLQQKVETTKKIPHDRTQIKLEKMREKVDYLQDIIKDEKGKKVALEQENQHLQRCNESLITEKKSLLKSGEEIQMKYNTGQSAYTELTVHVNDLLCSIHKLRCVISQFALKWKPVLDKVESVGLLLRHLSELVDGAPCITITKFSGADGHKTAIEQSKNDLQTISLIMDALGNYSIQTSSTSTDFKSTSTMALSLKNNFIRPMSPDSPNLEALNAVHPASAGAGDVNLYCFDGDSTSLDSDVIAVDDPLDDLNRIYLLDNLELLIRSVRLEESTPLEEGKAFVEEFVLTFMFDCIGYKQRLETQFQSLKELVTKITDQLRTIVSGSVDCRKTSRTNQGLESIVRSLSALSRSAEQYGALQEEYKMSKTIHTLISYITHLSKQVDDFKMNSRRSTSRLSSENVYVDTVRESLSTDNRSLQRAHLPNRLMCLLNNIRPRNLLQLVCALGLAFLLFIYSNNFFMLAEHGGNGIPICWSTWNDFLAPYFEWQLPNGPPPI